MSNFSNSGEDALIAKLVCDGADNCIPYTDAEIPSVYHVDHCVAWVKKEGFKKVWLQFPQDCCRDAPLVLLKMQEQLLKVDLVIIFNSSANKCCANLKTRYTQDEEGLIQFGRSCGTDHCPIPRLRVAAPHWLADPERVCETILRLCEESQLAEGNKKVIILYDMRCAYVMSSVYEKLQALPPGVVMSRRLCSFSTQSDVNPASASPSIKDSGLICVKNSDSLGSTETNRFDEESQSSPSVSREPQSASNVLEDELDQHCECQSNFCVGLCRGCAVSFTRNVKRIDDIPESSASSTDGDGYFYVKINDIYFKLPSSVRKSDISFIYIGRKGPTLTSLSLKLASFAFHVVDPVTGETFPSTAQKIIMQRNYKLEQIRDAQKIGILISGLNVNPCSTIVKRLISLITSCDKKFIIQTSAHPDLPTLMNVPGVDVFVNLSCSESTVVERDVDPDLYKILVTPWEMEVALNPSQEWSMNFETNTNELLLNPDYLSNWNPHTSTFIDDVASVSLLSNKTQALRIAPSTETPPPQALNGESGALVADHCRQVAQRLEAGRHLGLLKGEMPWYGLDPNTEAPSEIGTVVEGRRGIAGGYSEEGSS